MSIKAHTETARQSVTKLNRETVNSHREMSSELSSIDSTNMNKWASPGLRLRKLSDKEETRCESDNGTIRNHANRDSFHNNTSASMDTLNLNDHVSLRHRRKGSDLTQTADDDTQSDEDDIEDFDESMITSIKLTLMEEVLLLGLKDKEGYTSFWNDNISVGLRGAILVELALHKRIELENTKMRKKSLCYKRIMCIDSTPTGDVILDEALKHIKVNSGSFSVQSWVDFLSGDTWNPINFRFHMRNLRERLAKNLADKGVCGTQKQNFLIFDMTTHPLSNKILKSQLVKRIQFLLLTRWRSELQRFKPRSLALLYLAQASDVLDNALANLTYSDFDLASKHTRDLLAVDPDQESVKYDNRMEMLWAVVSTFSK